MDAKLNLPLTRKTLFTKIGSSLRRLLLFLTCVLSPDLLRVREDSSSMISISKMVIGGKERMEVEWIGSLDFPHLLNLSKLPWYR